MQVDLKQVLRNLNGDPIKQPNPNWVPKGEEDVPPLDALVEVTLSTILVNVLLGNYKDEEALAGSERLARFKLASKIHDADSITLSVDDLERIRQLIPRMYGTLVAGTVLSILEQESKTDKE